MTGAAQLPCVVVEIRCPANHVHRRQALWAWLHGLSTRPRCPICRRAAELETLGSALAETGWVAVAPEPFVATGTAAPDRLRECAARGRATAKRGAR